MTYCVCELPVKSGCRWVQYMWSVSVKLAVMCSYRTGIGMILATSGQCRFSTGILWQVYTTKYVPWVCALFRLCHSGDCVSKIESVLSIPNLMHYTELFVFSLSISRVKIVRICVLLFHSIIIKSEVRTINHCLGLGHETMVCAVCLACSYWFFG